PHGRHQVQLQNEGQDPETAEREYIQPGDRGQDRRRDQAGTLTFHCTKFHPNGELSISKPNIMHYIWNNYDNQNSPAKVLEIIKKQRFNLYKGMATSGVEYKDFTREQRQILRNVPFAYRGFVFKTKKLQDFFNSTKWYVANPNYKVDMNELTEDEREWVEYWTE
ncbi:MAG: YARHG domain-containing protein, partial [Bacteroidales bacterium]|nr:YARHG domain-containing protein [Bacteroidales bacterium]